MGGATGDAGIHPSKVSLWEIARSWTRLGCVGFGGPPAHIALLRRLCVEERHWIEPGEFEDGVAAVNLLPGPASTQLAIFCAWRLRGRLGGVLGGICFIVPGLVLILLLAAVFLSRNPPDWVLGTAAGAGAAVPAVALKAAAGFVPASWARIGALPAERLRWVAYGLCGGLTASLAGPELVLVILACGLTELAVRRRIDRGRPPAGAGSAAAALGGHLLIGGLSALAWVAFKVGALSYGGGFVIVPLMQHDAVTTYHWMTGTQFLDAVALGQVTPGPVVLTTAVVGYAARGIGGGLLATLVAFAPSFVFVLAGGPHFDRVRASPAIQWFFAGAGPTVIGAIAGSAVPLGLELHRLWQVAVLGGALAWLLAARRGVVSALVLAGAAGAALALAGVAV